MVVTWCSLDTRLTGPCKGCGSPRILSLTTPKVLVRAPCVRLAALQVLTVEAQMLMVAAFTCIVLSMVSYSTDRPNAKASSPMANLEPAAVPPLSPTKQGEALGTSYASMRWRYLAVYLPGVFGDWIQVRD